jgi:hypothetical protein
VRTGKPPLRHPILLPKDHTVTRLIIKSAHENLGHGSGIEHVLTELRARFWIIKGRRTVRNTIEKCSGVDDSPENQPLK